MPEFITKQKIQSEDLIGISILVILVILALFFKRLTFISIIVYPSFGVFIYGSIKIRNLFRDKDIEILEKTLKLIFWFIGILITIIAMIFVFISPTMTLSIVLYLIALPVLCVGLAAIFKGFLVRQYSTSLRGQNIVVGIITLTYAIFAMMSSIDLFFMHLGIFGLLLILNLVLRSSLYLSEFNLSIWNKESYKILYYILSGNYLEIQKYYPDEEE